MNGIADRIRDIANLVDRAGVYEMLHDIADEIDAHQQIAVDNDANNNNQKPTRSTQQP